MVGEVAGDHLGAAVLAAQLPVLAGELDGGLHRVAARGGEEHAVQVAGCVLGEPGGQGDGGFVGERPDREVAERLALPGGCLGQLLAAVADLHGEQPRQPVEVALAVLVVDVAAFAAGDDRHLAVGEPTEAGEVHPQVTLGVVGQLGHDRLRKS